jgi:glycosyltransferase involved in cell wall biosynthesis
MKKLIIYLKEVSARIDSAMTLQVLNDYGYLSNLNNKVVVFIFAKNIREINQMNQLVLENKFNNLHLCFLPQTHKVFRSFFLLTYALLSFFRGDFSKKIVIVREKKYLQLVKIIKRIFGFFLIVELHETCIPTQENKQERVKYQKLLINNHGVLFTNPSQFDYFSARQYMLPKNKLVLPNGLNLRNFTKAKGRSLKTKPFVLTYAGQFTPWKNIPLIFEALKYLPTHFHLRIAGGKENSDLSADYINELIDRYSLMGRVTYLGFIYPTKLVKEVLNNSSILLVPLDGSVIAQYATAPMKLLEFMATSIPIVAVKAPSVIGLAGTESVFLTQSNAKDFAKIILSIYKTKTETLKKRIFAQNQIAKHYDYKVRAKQYNNWLDRLIL